jgi:hypothetical protein
MRRLIVVLVSALLLSCGQQEPMMTGAELSDSATYAEVPFSILPQNEKFFRREVTMKILQGFPGAENQGDLGSCVCWASGFYLMSYQKAQLTPATDQFNASNIYNPLYVYNLLQAGSGQCSANGVKLTDALNLMVDKGTVTLEKFPERKDCGVVPDPRLSQEARRSKFKNYSQLCNPGAKLAKGVAYQKIKNYILNGSPVLITMPVNSTFKCLKSTDTVWKSFGATSNTENHTMLCVGFSDDLNAVQVINSWGSKWGRNGRGWIKGGLLDDYLLEAMVPNIDRRFLIDQKNFLFANYSVKGEEVSFENSLKGNSQRPKTVVLEENKFRDFDQFMVVPCKVLDSLCLLKFYELKGGKTVLKEFTALTNKDVFSLNIQNKSYQFKLKSTNLNVTPRKVEIVVQEIIPRNTRRINVNI